MSNHFIAFFLVVFFACEFFSFAASAQTTQEEFGQNRVQYKEFNWSHYSTAQYSVYFYLGGQELGKFVSMDAPQQIQMVEKTLEYKLQDPIEIIVYNNIDELRQSNIGRYLDLMNTGGVTRIVGNKVFLYFDGNHEHLSSQLREGIAILCLQNMLFGGNVQEVLQNAVLLNLPDWYKLGLASYIGYGWTANEDERLRSSMNSGLYKSLNKLSPEQAVLAGHSFWHYIATQYGLPAIPNILYVTRINHSLEAGFTYVLNRSFKQVMREWYSHYENIYKQQPLPPHAGQSSSILSIKLKRTRIYPQFAVSPLLNYAAIVSNNNGLYKVQIQNLDNNKRTTILRGGYRDQTMPIDMSNPLIAWSPDGNTLSMVNTRRGKIYILQYDVSSKKTTKKQIANFQRIVSFSYGETASQLIISAINRGQSDIYVYNSASGSIRQITNDFWDDLEPSFIRLHNRQGILFLSNRPDDSLRQVRLADTLAPLGKLDVYFYNTKTQSKVLVRVTNTPLIDEAAPVPYDRRHLSYLSIRNDVYNRNIAYIDSVFHHNDYYYYFPDSTVVNPKYNVDSLKRAGQWKPDSATVVPVYKDVAHSFADTDYKVNIAHQYNAGRRDIMVEQFMRDERPVYILTPTAKSINSPEIKFDTNYEQQVDSLLQPSEAISEDTLDVSSYYFQSEFTWRHKHKPTQTKSQVEEDVNQTNRTPVVPGRMAGATPFKPTRVLPYIVKFSTDYVLSQLDNNLIVTRYQSYNTNGGQFQNPQLGGLIKLGITELFEDYRINGGFRLPTTINGTEYFVSFEDYKKRLDKKYTLYRRAKHNTYDFTGIWALPVEANVITNYAEASLRYPLDYNRSFRSHLSYRQDRIIYLATDTFSLGLSDYRENWAAVRGEYVFDNTLKVQLNILDGTRFKLFTDVQKLLDKKNYFTFAVGADIRHYLKIHRQIIWATRVFGATSWGDAKIAYMLGGTEGWIFPKIAKDPNSSDNTRYAFMNLATHVRGLPQAVRQGNSVALINSEIRFPVFAYLSNAPLKSEFIRNFQILAFIDAGTAWLGLSPYSLDNPFNTKVFVSGPVAVKVNYFREPLVLGTGAGIRTTLLGYFVRVDYASGWDSGEWRDPIWHFSLGLDF